MLSDVSPFSHAVKSPLKNGQVLGMDKAIREARSWGGKQESEFPKEASEIKSVPLSHLPWELYRATTELKGHMHSKTNTFPGFLTVPVVHNAAFLQHMISYVTSV